MSKISPDGSSIQSTEISVERTASPAGQHPVTGSVRKLADDQVLKAIPGPKEQSQSQSCPSDTSIHSRKVRFSGEKADLTSISPPSDLAPSSDIDRATDEFDYFRTLFQSGNYNELKNQLTHQIIHEQTRKGPANSSRTDTPELSDLFYENMQSQYNGKIHFLQTKAALLKEVTKTVSDESVTKELTENLSSVQAELIHAESQRDHLQSVFDDATKKANAHITVSAYVVSTDSNSLETDINLLKKKINRLTRDNSPSSAATLELSKKKLEGLELALADERLEQGAKSKNFSFHPKSDAMKDHDSPIWKLRTLLTNGNQSDAEQLIQSQTDQNTAHLIVQVLINGHYDQELQTLAQNHLERLKSTSSDIKRG